MSHLGARWWHHLHKIIGNAVVSLQTTLSSCDTHGWPVWAVWALVYFGDNHVVSSHSHSAHIQVTGSQRRKFAGNLDGRHEKGQNRLRSSRYSSSWAFSIANCNSWWKVWPFPKYGTRKKENRLQSSQILQSLLWSNFAILQVCYQLFVELQVYPFMNKVQI